MAILQSISLREIPKTFGELATLYLKKVGKIARESSANTVHLVTDQYPTVSIKNAERDRRAKVQSASQLRATQIFSVLSCSWWEGVNLTFLCKLC